MDISIKINLYHKNQIHILGTLDKNIFYIKFIDLYFNNFYYFLLHNLLSKDLKNTVTIILH